MEVRTERLTAPVPGVETPGYMLPPLRGWMHAGMEIGHG